MKSSRVGLGHFFFQYGGRGCISHPAPQKGLLFDCPVVFKRNCTAKYTPFRSVSFGK